jgi:hypothetical protein
MKVRRRVAIRPHFTNIISLAKKEREKGLAFSSVSGQEWKKGERQEPDHLS